jgi:hypothetical protein
MYANLLSIVSSDLPSMHEFCKKKKYLVHIMLGRARKWRDGIQGACYELMMWREEFYERAKS